MILPLYYGKQWMFAVVRQHCIQWFDSRPNSAAPQDLITDVPVSTWTGPKQNQDQDHDSGLFMLLGIRRIASGFPPVDDEQASSIIPGFRSTILIGLLANKLMPDEEDLLELGVSEGFFCEGVLRLLQETSSDISSDTSQKTLKVKSRTN